MNLRVLRDRVVLKLDPVQEKKGSIILPNQDQRVRTGVVQSTGPGREKSNGVREPTGVSPGDRVAFLFMNLETSQGDQVTRALQELGEDLVSIQDRDILFIIEGDIPEME
jgi:co-chaperonin GroES (HSP10)